MFGYGAYGYWLGVVTRFNPSPCETQSFISLRDIVRGRISAANIIIFQDLHEMVSILSRAGKRRDQTQGSNVPMLFVAWAEIAGQDV